MSMEHEAASLNVILLVTVCGYVAIVCGYVLAVEWVVRFRERGGEQKRVSRKAFHGLCRADVSQSAHGPCRPSGGRDERDFTASLGRSLGRGEAVPAMEGCGVLDHVVWHLRELGGHDTGRDLWDGGPVPDYRSRPQRSALAGGACDSRLGDCRGRHSCSFDPGPVGSAPKKQRRDRSSRVRWTRRLPSKCRPRGLVAGENSPIPAPDRPACMQTIRRTEWHALSTTARA